MNKESIREAVRHAIVEVQAVGPPMSAATFGMLAGAAADRAADKIAAPLLTLAHNLAVAGAMQRMYNMGSFAVLMFERYGHDGWKPNVEGKALR